MEDINREDLDHRIKLLADKIFEAQNIDLIDFKVSGSLNDIFIQITADKPSGGINIRECAILNKTLAARIEQEKLLPADHFSLELSSPGLDRPLVTRKDFIRFKGQELHIWLKEPVAGKKEVRGILTEIGENSVIIEVSHSSKLVLPLNDIIKGLLVI
ncbi:MAG: hypothetical protein HQL14_02300 [Candidatus Omnitrophica bacterium]|nr:hypothetical protein [Candidatus Omnitrophota bacterium]